MRHVCHDYLLFERFFFEGGGQAEVGDIGFDVVPSRLHVIDIVAAFTVDEENVASAAAFAFRTLGLPTGEETRPSPSVS